MVVVGLLLPLHTYGTYIQAFNFNSERIISTICELLKHHQRCVIYDTECIQIDATFNMSMITDQLHQPSTEIFGTIR